ncbi:acyl-CoA thioesterase [Aggregatilinea lenta]|uniref:acyl-CoA thioesterase n=1 Tax=Aggregatilinea lenta TaxID=913108 RepID=UPI000E5A3622|nr:acyl-CoA thioesterase [Aggregatilinea lenta]
MAENVAAAKPVAESRVVLCMMMNPEHANALGNVHGGVITKLADEAGGLAAMRHARTPVVTVAIDSMTFEEPIYVGNMVTLTAELTYTGRTSMEVRVSVMAEDPLTGYTVHTNLAYLVYVAIDSQGRPHPVPPLRVETPEEQMRYARAKERQDQRKQRHQYEQAARQRTSRDET